MLLSVGFGLKTVRQSQLHPVNPKPGTNFFRAFNSGYNQRIFHRFAKFYSQKGYLIAKIQATSLDHSDFLILHEIAG